MAPSTPSPRQDPASRVQATPHQTEATPAPAEERALLSIDANEVETNSEPVEDPTPRILDEATYGYAAIYVYDVEPQWNKYDASEEANRPLDLEHAKRIAEYMKANLKIADAPNRLCITMSQDQIDRSLHTTAVYELYRGNMKWYNQNKDSPEVTKEVTARMGQIDESIKKKVKRINVRLSGSKLTRSCRRTTRQSLSTHF
jgi:hypothetical protein